MKMGDLVVALDINCGTYVRHTERDEEGLMTFVLEVDTSLINQIDHFSE